MRIAAELKLAPTHAAPNETRSCNGNDQQSEKLLPVHQSEDSRGAQERKRNLCVCALLVEGSKWQVPEPRRRTCNLHLSHFNLYAPRMSHQTFAHAHRVTYAECTIGNHVYYARYLDLLETARGEMFRSLGMTFQQLHDSGTVFPVIEARLLYKGAARYDDVLRIEIWLTELERVRMNFAYRILNEAEKLLVEGSTSHACASPDDKLKRLPEDLIVKLQPYVEAESA